MFLGALCSRAMPDGSGDGSPEVVDDPEVAEVVRLLSELAAVTLTDDERARLHAFVGRHTAESLPRRRFRLVLSPAVMSAVGAAAMFVMLSVLVGGLPKGGVADLRSEVTAVGQVGRLLEPSDVADGGYEVAGGATNGKAGENADEIAYGTAGASAEASSGVLNVADGRSVVGGGRDDLAADTSAVSPVSPGPTFPAFRLPAGSTGGPVDAAFGSVMCTPDVFGGRAVCCLPLRAGVVVPGCALGVCLR